MRLWLGEFFNTIFGLRTDDGGLAVALNECPLTTEAV
jgi:hypothetical protein